MALTIAVIGYGSIGQRHIGNLRGLGCDVTAFDIDPDREVPHPSSLIWSEVDAVVIATPYETHLEYVVGAIAHGTPFFVEKPLGSIEQIERWKELAGYLTLPLHQVGYQCRFHPEAEIIKAREGKRIVDAKCFVDMRTWPGVYGDPLLECSHDIDLALWWGAPPVVSRLVDQSQLERPEGPGDWFYLGDESAIQASLWFRYQEEPWHREWSCDGKTHGYQTAFWKDKPIGDQVYVDEMKHFLIRLEIEQSGLDADDGEMSASVEDGIKVLEVCRDVQAMKERDAGDHSD